MQKRPEIVQTAEKVAAGEADAPAPREALAGLLEAHKKLRNRYLYLLHEGHPEPVHTLDGADSLEELSERWRDEADTLRAHGAEGQATSLERCATDLDVALRSFQREEMALPQAAAWSGYSPKRLRELVREGKIPDNRPDGSQGPIRVRRCDLPRKPGAERDAVSAADRLYARLAR